MTRGRLAAVVAVAALLLFWAPACSSDPVRRISLSGRPSAVAVLDDLIWITDDAASVVRTIDAETAEQTGDPVRVARNPVAVAAGSEVVWVGHAGGEVSRIDARTREVRTVEAGSSITGIAARGSRVWAADLATKSLVELDAGSLEVRRVYRLNDGVVRVAPAGSVLWVTNSERTVTRVDPLSHDVGPAVPTGLGPIGLVSTRGRLWVANSDDGTVTVIDTRRGRPAGRPVSVGLGPVAVTAAGGSVWVANQDDGTLVRVDPVRAVVVGEPTALGLHPRAIAAGEDAVWVVGTNPSGVVRVDL